MKKLGILVLTLMLLVSSVACAEVTFTPGTYRGNSQGMYGNIGVDVTVSENTIDAIEVVELHDTPVIANAAVEEIPQKVIAAQSIGVDITTGATFTSGAMLGAIRDALKQTSCDMNAVSVRAEKTVAQLPDENYDVVIIGGGGAGMSAAQQIGRTSDYSVLVLEKNAWFGGSTALAGGAFDVRNTPANEATGLDLTADQFLQYYKDIAASRKMRPEGMWINETLVHEIGERMDPIANYYMEEGLQYSPRVMGYIDKENMIGITSATVNAGEMWGGWLPELAKKNGAEIRNNAKVTELIIEDGLVKGVVVATPNSTYNVYAKKIIVATGGFGANLPLLREMNQNFEGIEYIWNSTNPGSTGDALTFCAPLDPDHTGYGFIAAAGSIYNYGIDEPTVGGFMTSTASFFVNQNGERFMDENVYYYDRGIGICAQPGGYCWTIIDADMAYRGATISDNEAFMKTLNDFIDKKYAFRANTLEELAAQIGVDEATFMKTCEAYNAEKGTRINEMFGAYSPIEDDVVTAPFYAIKTYGNVLSTLYGFKLDNDLHIVNKAGEAIPNVFAAGEVAMGNFFFEKYMYSGNAVTCAIMSGTMAGDRAVAELNAAK